MPRAVSEFDTMCGMNSAQRKTLEAIFADPVNGNLPWRRIESLLLALGAEKDE